MLNFLVRCWMFSFVLAAICSVHVSTTTSFAQEDVSTEQVRQDLIDYTEIPLIDEDEFALRIRSKYWSDPDIIDAHEAHDEYILLKSRQEDLTWRKATRSVDIHGVRVERAASGEAIPDCWSELRIGKKFFSRDAAAPFGEGDPSKLFEFTSDKPAVRQTLPFLEAHRWPISFEPERISSGTSANQSEIKTFAHFSKCLKAVKQGNQVESLWARPESLAAVVLTTENSLPVQFKIYKFPNQVGDKVPDIKKGRLTRKINTTWKETENARLPVKIMIEGENQGRTYFNEIEMELDVRGNLYKIELERIKKTDAYRSARTN